jgi:MFS family permease
MAAAMGAYSLGLLAFAHSHWLPLSVGIMLFTGIGMMMTMAGTNTLLQTLVEEDKRGRVMALYTMAFMGSGPLGSLWAGAAATHIGAPLTVYCGSLACLIATGIFVSRLPMIRAEAAVVLARHQNL